MAVVFACLFAVMAIRPETLAFWRIHRRPASLAATRGVGVAGLLAMALLLIWNLAR